MKRHLVAGQILLEYVIRTTLAGGLLAGPYIAIQVAVSLIGDILAGPSTSVESPLWSTCLILGLIVAMAALVAWSVGSGLGLLVGLTNGILIATLTMLLYFPLKNPNRYYLLSGILTTLVSVILMLVLTPIVHDQIYDAQVKPGSLVGWLQSVGLPATIAGIANLWVTRRALRSYVASIEKATNH